jgi:electron transport complex protein RnfD
MNNGNSNRLVVSLSPHQKGDLEVEKIMWGVVIALAPAFLGSVYFFGFQAIRVVVLSLVFCIGSEYLIQKFMLKQKVTAFDGSAAITGLLLAFNVPGGVPWWQLLAGSVVAIGVAKMAFGGLGKNPFNPALVGRAFMLASFPVEMTTWPVPLQKIWTLGADAVTSATPLGILAEKGPADLPSYLDLFLGKTGGCIGEISALAILIGGIFMLYKKIITWHIPVFYLLSLAGFTGLLWLIDSSKYADPLFHLLAGGAMLGAWFMATDMVTSPMSVKGQIIFAVAGGILCGAIRVFGSYPEGCSYSILIMNAFVPLIDKYVKPKRFGKEVNYGQ